MPELPEIETTLQGIKPSLLNQTIRRTVVRNDRLRYPVTPELAKHLTNNTITNVTRRAKYLLIEFTTDHLLIHLGMSGHLRLLSTPIPPAQKHDHIDIELINGMTLRYNDPRRFGLVLWLDTPPNQHKLLKNLGPEPLSDGFTTDYLWSHCSKKTAAIKNVIMSNQIVVGVGNIYASESLFMAGINPNRQAKTLSFESCKNLVSAIKQILHNAIIQGGTTLKDFYASDGKPGYFSQSLAVYGRQGQACNQCQKELLACKIGQRNTVYCDRCQQ